MTTDEALVKMGESTAEAVVGSLSMFCGDAVSAFAPVVVALDGTPAAGLDMPAVVAEVSYVDGVTGGNLFVMPAAGVHALAAAMMGMDPASVDGTAELGELELSAAGEAANQMMAAAAGAASTVLGQEVEIAAPEVRVAASPDEAMGDVAGAAAIVSVPFEVLGHACRLIQLVPHSFVVRMTRAMDDLASEYAEPEPAAATAAPAAAFAGAVQGTVLGDVSVRVWAELGRARMPIRQAVGLPAGAVVDLDRALEDPIDLFVNGRRFATGRLVTVDGGDWAVRIDSVSPQTNPTHINQGDG